MDLSLAAASLTVSPLFDRGFAVTLLYGKINSEKQLEQCEQSYLPPTQVGILKVRTEQFDPSCASPREIRSPTFDCLSPFALSDAG